MSSVTTIVLASTSPRRRALLEAVLSSWPGSRLAVISPGLDDADLPMGLGCAGRLDQWVASLAFLKARAGAEAWLKTSPDAGGVVVGADTLVDQDGAILSKPADAADAARMLRLVRGRSHEVLTGVALFDLASGAREVWSERAVVRVGDITDCQIVAYTSGPGWRGKSGGYNLQERLDEGWPLEVDGDPGCVTGLPTRSLLPRLRAFVRRCSLAEPRVLS